MNNQVLWERWLPNHKRIGDEQIIYFLRRHWFVLFTKYLFLSLFGLIPVFFYFFFGSSFPTLYESSSTRAILLLVTSLYYLFLWVVAFNLFIDYYLDLWIVTSHRIVDREQKGLFNIRVSEQNLSQVQDVSASVKGILPTVIDYGNVLVQSAAAKNLFQFQQIPQPELISREINRIAQEYQKYHDHENSVPKDQ